MKTHILAAVLVLSCVTVLLTGCGTEETQTGFAQGAFPPILSDTEYHQEAWTRTDCLTCHETGENEAPITRHSSLPPEAVQSKCRTCHVFIPGSPPVQ